MKRQLTWFMLAVGVQLGACSNEELIADAMPPRNVAPEEHAPGKAAADGSFTLYEDALGTGWVDWSWATRNLTATSPVASGTRAVSVTFGPWTGLYFHHTGVSTTGLEFLELQVHGGATANPALTAYATVGNQARPTISINRYCDGGAIKAGAWTRCRVPLTALNVANDTLDGIAIQEGAGRSLPVMTFDSLRLGSATLPAPGDVKAVASASDVSLTWNTVSDATGYHVYRATSQMGTYTKRTTAPLTNTTYRDTRVTAGATYWYAVTAVGTRGEGLRSAPVSATVQSPQSSGEKWVSGYYTGWNADLYPPEKVDFSALTHIIVGRVTPRADGTLDTRFDNDNGPHIARTLAQRAHAAGRKAIIMVGGAGEHAGWVAAASNVNRAKFVQNLLEAMDRFGYDGLDIDWEPVEEADKPNLLALVRELRAARPDMLLTFPIGWINTNVASDADPWFANLAPYLDQINVMSYEMIGPWDGWQSWYTSALYGESGNRPTSVSSSLQGWARAGIPKAKLGMGIPFYGMAWRNITGPYQRFTSWADYVGSDNAFTYRKIQQLSASGTYRWDAVAAASYLTFTTPVEDGTVRWISYDGPQAIAAKGAYARDNGFGGTIIWTLNQGCTNPTTGANPLLDAVKDAFLQ